MKYLISALIVPGGILLLLYWFLKDQNLQYNAGRWTARMAIKAARAPKVKDAQGTIKTTVADVAKAPFVRGVTDEVGMSAGIGQVSEIVGTVAGFFK